MFRNALDAMTPAQLRANWSLFAEVLMAEAGEARVEYHAFSLPRFICFLCSDRQLANSMTNPVHVHADVT